MATKKKSSIISVTAPAAFGDLFLPKADARLDLDADVARLFYRVSGSVDDLTYGDVTVAVNAALPEGLGEPASVAAATLQPAARRAGAAALLCGADAETLAAARDFFLSRQESRIEIDRMTAARPGTATRDALDTIRLWYASDNEQQIVDAMNARHFVVDIGSSTVIGTEYDDGVVIFQRPRDLELRYDSEAIQVGTTGTGTRAKPIYKNTFEIWRRSTRRRTFRRVVFKPTPKPCHPKDYNLWTGFAVEPDAAKSCALYLKHMHDIICNGNDEHYRYLLDLMALTVQEPGVPSEVATVLRGGQGTGKGFFVREFGAIFGNHFKHVDKAGHLTGKFNAQLSGKVVIFADEAVWAGNKQDIGPLKRLITEPTLTIERKGIDVVSEDNCVHLFMATNAKWAIPADIHERRFFVLDVSNTKMQNADYFEPLYREMEHGGRSALLALLLNRKFDRKALRSAPKTAALLDQQDRSLDFELQWWKSVLVNGELDEGAGWPTARERFISEEALQWSYLHLCEQQRARRRLARIDLLKAIPMPDGKTLFDLPRPRAKAAIFSESGKRLTKPDGKPITEARDGRLLPALTACREAFDRFTGLVRDWPSVEKREQKSLPMEAE